MTKVEFEKFKEFMTTQEGLAWTAHQNTRWLVEKSYQSIFEAVRIKSKEEALRKALIVTRKILKNLSLVINLDTIDAGHGIGHLSRDYFHALLLSEEAMDCRHLYVGVVAAILHDVLGCSLIDRYDDKHRAVKHAEAGALLWSKMASEIGIDPVESSLVYYGIAGHTNLLKETAVKCSDGVERTLTPYVDEDESGPRLMFWLPRHVDRLDANGPCFIGRHYLTLARDHSDLDHSGSYYKVRFEAHMRPLLRSEEEIRSDPEGRTLREHLMMYAKSQNNSSPYGKYDGEVMCHLRDSYKNRLLRIIQSFDDSCCHSARANEKIIGDWNEWLSTKVEPSSSGMAAALTLGKRFEALPIEIRRPWINAMSTAMRQYQEWRSEAQNLISKFPEDCLATPLIGNLRFRL